MINIPSPNNYFDEINQEYKKFKQDIFKKSYKNNDSSFQEQEKKLIISINDSLQKPQTNLEISNENLMIALIGSEILSKFSVLNQKKCIQFFSTINDNFPKSIPAKRFFIRSIVKKIKNQTNLEWNNFIIYFHHKILTMNAIQQGDTESIENSLIYIEFLIQYSPEFVQKFSTEIIIRLIQIIQLENYFLDLNYCIKNYFNDTESKEYYGNYAIQLLLKVFDKTKFFNFLSIEITQVFELKPIIKSLATLSIFFEKCPKWFLKKNITKIQNFLDSITDSNPEIQCLITRIKIFCSIYEEKDKQQQKFDLLFDYKNQEENVICGLIQNIKLFMSQKKLFEQIKIENQKIKDLILFCFDSNKENLKKNAFDLLNSCILYNKENQTNYFDIDSTIFDYLKQNDFNFDSFEVIKLMKEKDENFFTEKFVLSINQRPIETLQFIKDKFDDETMKNYFVSNENVIENILNLFDNNDNKVKSLSIFVAAQISPKQFFSEKVLQKLFNLLSLDSSNKIKISILQCFNTYLADLSDANLEEKFFNCKAMTVFNDLLNNSIYEVQIETIKLISKLASFKTLKLEEIVKPYLILFENENDRDIEKILISAEFLPYIFDSFPQYIPQYFQSFYNFSMDLMNSLLISNENSIKHSNLNTKNLKEKMFTQTIFCSYTKSLETILNKNKEIIKPFYEEIINFCYNCLENEIDQLETQFILSLLKKVLFEMGLNEVMSNKKIKSTNLLFTVVYKTGSRFMCSLIHRQVFEILGFLGAQPLFEGIKPLYKYVNEKDRLDIDLQREMIKFGQFRSYENIYYIVCSNSLFKILENESLNYLHFQAFEAIVDLIKVMPFSPHFYPYLKEHFSRCLEIMTKLIIKSDNDEKKRLVLIIQKMLKFSKNIIIDKAYDFVQLFFELWDYGSIDAFPLFVQVFANALKPYVKMFIPFIQKNPDVNTVINSLNKIFLNCFKMDVEQDPNEVVIMMLLIDLANNGNYQVIDIINNNFGRIRFLNPYVKPFTEMCVNYLKSDHTNDGNLDYAVKLLCKLMKNSYNMLKTYVPEIINLLNESQRNLFLKSLPKDEAALYINKDEKVENAKNANETQNKTCNFGFALDGSCKLKPATKFGNIEAPTNSSSNLNKSENEEKKPNQINKGIKILEPGPKQNQQSRNIKFADGPQPFQQSKNIKFAEPGPKQTQESKSIKFTDARPQQAQQSKNIRFADGPQPIQQSKNIKFAEPVPKQTQQNKNIKFADAGSQQAQQNKNIKFAEPGPKQTQQNKNIKFADSGPQQSQQSKSIKLPEPGIRLDQQRTSIKLSDPGPRQNIRLSNIGQSPQRSYSTNFIRQTGKRYFTQLITSINDYIENDADYTITDLWLNDVIRFSIQNSPSPIISSCFPIAKVNESLSLSIFNVAFHSMAFICNEFINFSEDKKQISSSFLSILNSNKTSHRCHAILTDLIEFMDRLYYPLFEMDDFKTPLPSIFSNKPPISLRYSLLKFEKNMKPEFKEEILNELEQSFLNCGSYDEFNSIRSENSYIQNHFPLFKYSFKDQKIPEKDEIHHEIVSHLFKIESLIQNYLEKNDEQIKNEIINEINLGFDCITFESGPHFSQGFTSVIQSIIYSQQLIELKEMISSNFEEFNFRLRILNSSKTIRFIPQIYLMKILTKRRKKDSFTDKLNLLSLFRKCNEWDLMNHVFDEFYQKNDKNIPVEIQYEMMYNKINNNSTNEEEIDNLINQIKNIQHDDQNLLNFAKFQKAMFISLIDTKNPSKLESIIELCRPSIEDANAIELCGSANLKIFEITHDYSRLNESIKNYTKSSLRSEKVRISSILTIIYLLFTYYNNDDDSKEIKIDQIIESLNEIPFHFYIEIMSQFISYVTTLRKNTFNNYIINLLTQIMINHPQGVIYDYSFSLFSDQIFNGSDTIESPINVIKESIRDEQIVKIFNEVESITYNLIDVNTAIPVDSENKNELNIFSLSPNLAKNRQMSLPVFGTYHFNEETIFIHEFSSKYKDIKSLENPKKIFVIGSDGNVYPFIMKEKEDLRTDQRIMIFHKFLNQQLRTKIKTYSIIPLTSNQGLIQFVREMIGISRLINFYRKKNSPEEFNYEFNFLDKNLYKSQSKGLNSYDLLTHIQRLEFFRLIVNNKKREFDLRDSFWYFTTSSEKWLNFITNYTSSYAVISMVTYIIGLGDRHLKNIMISKDNGILMNIDFYDVFEIDQKRDDVPEKVPFRLTRNLVAALGPSGINGCFMNYCEETLSVMRNNKDKIMNILSVFVDSPIQKLNSYAIPTLVRDADELDKSRMMAASCMKRISKKLNGTDVHIILANDDDPEIDEENVQKMSVHDHVKKLIDFATNDVNLCLLYSEWEPWK